MVMLKANPESGVVASGVLDPSALDSKATFDILDSSSKIFDELH